MPRSASSARLRASSAQGSIGARELFEQLLAVFPEARKLIMECEGKEDVPLTGATPGLQALIDLLVKKKLIDEAEWAQAVAIH